jgi:hypothetical protein
VGNGRKRIEGAGQKRASKGDGGRRRITKEDGKIAKIAELKSSASLVLPEVKKVLLKKHDANRERTARRSNNIFPSEMARSDWCPRATYYRMSGLPEPASSNFSFSLDNVFSEGNRIHEKWQGWLAETGDLWGDWYCKDCDVRVNNILMPSAGYMEPALYDSSIGPHYHDWEYKEVTLKSKAHRISGHADGALLSKNCLIEIKSMGLGTFRFEAPKMLKDHTYDVKGKKVTDIEGLWHDIHRPLISHVKQGNIYLYMCDEMDLPFDKIVFIYEFKANQQIKEFTISRSDAILAPLLDSASRIEYALSVGIPPVCPKEGCATCAAYEKEE